MPCPPVVCQVAPERHWVPQRLVAGLHVELEAQAVLEALLTASLKGGKDQGSEVNAMELALGTQTQRSSYAVCGSLSMTSGWESRI